MKINLQYFGPSGVFPVHQNVFKINIAGRTTVPGDFFQIVDLESFGLSIEGNTEEWTPMDLGGWARQAVTGKKLTISFKGKRNYGDQGNDYIASKLLSVGQSCQSAFQWTLPNGGQLTVNCIINITTPDGGDSTNIGTLEFDILSDGLPTYAAPGVLSTLTFTSVAGATPGSGKTKVASIAPVLGAGNSYMYKMNAVLATIVAYGSVLTAGNGWAPFVVGTEYTGSSGQQLVVVEVDGSSMAIKAGTAPMVVA